MTLWLSTVVRNEADRYLTRMLDCAAEMGAVVMASDDNSTDDTVKILNDYDAFVRINDGIPYWEHEGSFRQRHLEWMDNYTKEGDWIIAMDADETLSHPEMVQDLIHQAELLRLPAVSFPLYEFWSETEYRIDGYWHGARSPILYKWRPDGQVRPLPMGSGREPMYVQTLGQQSIFRQDRCHWLHWGYAREEDRVRKHHLYTSRDGGHGHNNDHVNSIVGVPLLRAWADNG